MKPYPGFKELSAAEKRSELLIEGRRSERIIKLHWLVLREREVRRFLVEVRNEIRSLRVELTQDHGLALGELRGEELSDRATRSAAR